VEDRIRAAKATGLANLPFDAWRRNAVWLELVLAAQDLTCWLQTLLDGELPLAEPKRLRTRLLHPAGRLPTTPTGWPCACRPPGREPASLRPRSPGHGACCPHPADPPARERRG
jgi:hypothetical protein